MFGVLALFRSRLGSEMAGRITLQAIATALLGAMIPAGAVQGLPFLVRDINPRPLISSSNPEQMVRVGSMAFFIADSPQGQGLWRSDGTEAGTVLVQTAEFVSGLSAAADSVYFVAYDATHGTELWRSDGTAAGTALVRDIVPGPQGAVTDFVSVAMGTTFFFVADDAVHGPELWVTDGTGTGTMLVRDIYPGPQSSFPGGFAVSAGRVLFVATDDVHGAELWRTDGTPGGTALVRDIMPGAQGSEPLALTDLDGVVFLRAEDAVHGRELWRTDGTEEGTVLVGDLVPGPEGSWPGDFTPVDGRLFFTTAKDFLRDLWVSDGTATGTRPVLVTPPIMHTNIGPLFNFAGRLVFVYDDGVHGAELWKSDGTTAGTELVADISPGPPTSWIAVFAAAGGVLYFFADDGVAGRELWRSDGTGAGTAFARDIHPGPGASTPLVLDTMVGIGDRLLLASDDGVRGRELWRSDGTESGTVLVRDIWPPPSTADSSPRLLTPFDGGLLFTANDERSFTELWRTDGTIAGTERVRDINPGPPSAEIGPLAVFDDHALFGATDGVGGIELWYSDGTAQGTARLADINPGPPSSHPNEFVRAGDALYFSAEDAAHGRELWRTDGSAGGTALVADIQPGQRSSAPVQLTQVGGTLFFAAVRDGFGGLWRSDGTEPGTVLVRNVYGGNLTDVAGTLYFTVHTEIWRSDGTEAGTVALRNFHPVSGQVVPTQLTAVGERLFFSAAAVSEVELWTFDGENFAALRELNRSNDHELTAAGGRLFFVARDPDHGEELWASDGTETGTRLVRDIDPGPASSSPRHLAEIDGRLLFAACDAESCKIWESDGSDPGTQPLADLGRLAPLAPFAVVDGLAYFPAFDFRYGNELRAAPLGGAPPCVGDCDGDAVVRVAELVRLVAAALGAPAACAEGALAPTVAQLVTAVNHALTGCVGTAP
jgi:ELWxxDGT repeat protein